MTQKPFDLVLFGATSFVGKITAHYLLERFGVEGDLKWAAAARSQSKLDALKAELGPAGADLPLIVADAMSNDDMAQLCTQTDAVASTVGPYALYGEALVKACAESGIDYCDLTGEVQWIRRMIERYQAAAVQSGARIVHCCGFDSIPSDLGVLFLQLEARKKFGAPCTEVRMRLEAWSGAVSGGTIASLLNVSKEAAQDQALRRELRNPYSICPPEHGYSHRQPRISPSAYDDANKEWVAPFVMEPINSRIVHRSNALLSNAYGDQFVYSEGMLMGPGVAGRVKANSFGYGMDTFMVMTAIPPLRAGLERFVLPAPGQGPTPKQQADGFYNMRFWGKTANGETLVTKVTGDMDPGYGSTAKMLGESAVLFREIPKSKKGGAFWTPATMFGEQLIERLVAHAGLTFDIA
ncbi:MAG: saccharopine dehydrogenase NADP-binding domain-containing protein [Chloroflexota bacterium]